MTQRPLWPFLLVTAILVLAAIVTKSGLHINTSESGPTGLWREEPLVGALEPGEFVLVCLPINIVDRLNLGAGNCPIGLEPLLKPIAAMGGDIIETSAAGIRINGGPLLVNTAPLAADNLGRPLLAWPFGVYTVAKDEVWLVSTHSPRSYDSRYFGPVETRAIVARGIAVLTLP